MLSARLLTGSVLFVALTFGASIAGADGPCYKDFRNSTPAEKARMTAILEIAKKSLPPAPAGWQIGGYEEISVAGSICRDVETRPWSYNIGRSYTRVDDYEARQKIMRDAAAYAAAEQQRKQPRLDAVTVKMQKLNEQQIALAQKGDLAGAEKIIHEIVKLQADYQKISDEGDSQARIAAAGKEMERDLHMSIQVQVNDSAKQRTTGAANFPLPPGATAAVRWTRPEDAERSAEGHALVLFGGWTYAEQTKRWVPALRGNAVPTAAHVISVEVTGDPARIDPLLQGIDFKGLATAFTK